LAHAHAIEITPPFLPFVPADRVKPNQKYCLAHQVKNSARPDKTFGADHWIVEWRSIRADCHPHLLLFVASGRPLAFFWRGA
jgi:hypothetical protein